MRVLSYVLVYVACTCEGRSTSLLRDFVYVKSQSSKQSKQIGACSPMNILKNFLLALQPSAVAAFASSSAATRTPLVLRMRDAVTQQEISLVGAIHFHPASIALIKDEITRGLEQHKFLAAVVVESDTEFWEEMLGDENPKTFDNEMHAAAGIALENNVSIMLGDAKGNHTVGRLSQLAKETLRDFIDPIGGWPAIFKDLADGWSSVFDTRDIAQSELLLDGEAPLSPSDFLQPEIFAGFTQLVSKLRPGLIKIFILCVLGVVAEQLFDLAFLDDMVDNVPLDTDLAWDAPLDAAFVLIAAFSFRLLQVVLLAERNAVFARSIRRAAEERNGPVVATFGALHINGVARLLLSEKEPAFVGPFAGDWWEAPKDLNFSTWGGE